MAKKLTFHSNLTEGIRILGLVTHLKDYRLAFHINRELEFQLKRYGDFQLTEGKGIYSWFYYNEGANYPKISLIGNNHEEGKLIPDLRMDYFFLVKNVYDEQFVSGYLSKLRKIPDLSMVFQADISKIKNIDALLEAEEMHELKQVLRPDHR